MGTCITKLTEEEKRKLYFMMNDYARDYHNSVKKLNIPDVISRLQKLQRFDLVNYRDGEYGIETEREENDNGDKKPLVKVNDFKVVPKSK